MYTGQWDRNQRTGKGIFVGSNGLQYVGDWLNGKPPLVQKRPHALSDALERPVGVLKRAHALAKFSRPTWRILRETR